MACANRATSDFKIEPPVPRETLSKERDASEKWGVYSFVCQNQHSFRELTVKRSAHSVQQRNRGSAEGNTGDKQTVTVVTQSINQPW